VRRVSQSDIAMLARIIQTVATPDITTVDIRSKNRTPAVAARRRIGMWLARELTNCTLPNIAAAFGQRHHTTAIYAISRVQQAMDTDDVYAARVRRLRASIEAEAVPLRRVG
jgi:chromosomal replication initiator protein